jgi:DNA (cytosine-5)-methyltransferase 1
MKYISVFSGIGGLESRSVRPALVCDSDPACRLVLGRRYPATTIHEDITTLEPPKVDIVVGGWPCQDLTAAGKMGGIKSSRSGLFFEMVDVAKRARAHTFIAENVPNLIVMRNGLDFDIVRDTLVNSGFPYIAWRTLNAREFNLPQERNRVFIVASKHRELALSLHAETAETTSHRRKAGDVAGFYWTAGGGRSICFCRGYVPALKIGASDNKGRSPVAIFYGSTVRKLSTAECLRLQGFETADFDGITSSNILRMAGNAVPLPVGQFVVDAIIKGLPNAGVFTGFDRIAESGFLDRGKIWSIGHRKPCLAKNLHEFIDVDSTDLLSAQASTGLLCRVIKSGKRVPLELFDALHQLSLIKDGKFRGSRSNSFEMIKLLDTAQFRQTLSAET